MTGRISSRQGNSRMEKSMERVNSIAQARQGIKLCKTARTLACTVCTSVPLPSKISGTENAETQKMINANTDPINPLQNQNARISCSNLNNQGG